MPRMTRIRFIAMILLVQATIVFSPILSRAQTSASMALSGLVSSQAEGPMEGVIVTARKDGATIAVSVVSDAQGHYRFPQNRLDSGHYALRIRAIGYELDGAGSAEITAGKAAQADLKLRKVDDISPQLTSAEWLLSAPGTDEQKKFTDCTMCHTLERIFRSHHTPAEWTMVLKRMRSYDSGSQPARPQVQHQEDASAPPPKFNEPKYRDPSIDYLASINLSTVSRWQFPLKTLPRPKGAATKVIFTEYDVPHPDAMPHDVAFDSEGFVWYADFGQQYIGRLDPRTGKVTEFPCPTPKADFPTGFRTMAMDSEGNLWLSTQSQGAIAEFNKKAGECRVWSEPQGRPEEGYTRVTGVLAPLDGKVWVQAPRGPQLTTTAWVIRTMDLKTGEWGEPINAFGEIPKGSPMASRPHNVYDIAADTQKNIYFMDYGSEFIGKIDAETGKIAMYQTPTIDSGPRRGHFDSQDRFGLPKTEASELRCSIQRTERFRSGRSRLPTTSFTTQSSTKPDTPGAAA